MHLSVYRRCPSCVQAQCRAQDTLLNSTGGEATTADVRADSAARARRQQTRGGAHIVETRGARGRKRNVSQSHLVGSSDALYTSLNSGLI
eukprot:scaffold41884_cov58-Phaeocystis_antarctica.AAC.3